MSTQELVRPADSTDGSAVISPVKSSDHTGPISSEHSFTDTDSIPALEVLLFARTYLFTLFHKAFGGNPRQDLLEELCCSTALNALDEYASVDSTEDKLRVFLSQIPARIAQGEMKLWDIEAEYTRAFIGPASLPALPWESPYLSKDAAFMQQSTLEIRSIYRAQGLEARASHHVPDDHISILCAFAAIQAQKARDALYAGAKEELRALLEEQCAFVRDHLASWLDDYAARMCRMKTALLYPQLAKGLAAFVKQDRDFCAEAILWIDDLNTELPQLSLADELKSAEIDLERLRALRLAHLEENELRNLTENSLS